MRGKFFFCCLVVSLIRLGDVFAQDDSTAKTSFQFKFLLEKTQRLDAPDGVLAVTKNQDGKVTTLIPTQAQLFHLLEENPDARAAYERKFSQLDKNTLKKIGSSTSKILFSDIQLLRSVDKIPENLNKINKQSCDAKGQNDWSGEGEIDLKVLSGQRVGLWAGGVYHFKSFTIEPNGVLALNSGRQKITYIKSDGDCTINGKIESKLFRSGAGSFQETSPDGEAITVDVQENNKGGNGGNGGMGSDGRCITLPPVPAGQGAAGTLDYGGGGGGGAYQDYAGKCAQGYRGYDTQDQRGGRSDWNESAGGDGGGRTPQRNGGYLYLKCMGKISFNGGSVDFSGEKGMPGLNGGNEGGGGGGGGPGGQGGILFLNKPPADFDFSKSNFSGGEGGAGGKGGSRAIPLRPGPTNKPGENGRNGERGFDGAPELI